MSRRSAEEGEARDAARRLWQAVSAGDPDASERVLRSHPKYAGRPPERLGARAITLRDAQEVVAREHGFGGWGQLVDAGADARRRWDPHAQMRQDLRVLHFAQSLGADYASVEHVLDSIASADGTAAGRVLAELGYERPTKSDAVPRGTSSTPAQQALVAFAAGLALGSGAPTVTDEHLLLAFAYTGAGVQSLQQRNLDADEIVSALAAAGVAVPPYPPPVAPLPPGPYGPRVYFRGRGEGVAPAINRRYPPGTVHTGFNWSSWKPGWGWVDAEDEVPLEEIVRSVITNPADVEVVPFLDAVREESRAREGE